MWVMEMGTHPKASCSMSLSLPAAVGCLGGAAPSALDSLTEMEEAVALRTSTEVIFLSHAEWFGILGLHHLGQAQLLGLCT